MAKIRIAVSDRAKELNPLAETIISIFVNMIERVSPFLNNIKDYDPGLPLEVRKELLKSAIERVEWQIASVGGDTWRISGPGIEMTRVIVADSNMLYHKFFEMDRKFQGTGIADEVLKASLELTDLMKLNKVALHANLDVGGYAWLRKGAWPHTGKSGVIALIEDFGRTTRSPEAKALYYSALDDMEELSEADLKKFVLSSEFRKYKPIFLGSDWNGSFNPNDPITRAAMTQGAEAAYELLLRSASAPALKIVPLTINEQIMADYVKFQMRSIGFSSSLARTSQEFLNETEEHINNILLKYGQKFEALGSYKSPEAIKLFAQLKVDLLKARTEAWNDVNLLVNDQLEQYAIQQAKAAAAVIEGPVPVVLGLNLPSAQTLYAIVTAQPFEGRVLGDWLARTAALDHERITKMAVQGIVDGLTPTEVARLVLGTKAMKGTDGYCRKAFIDLESVLLTTTSGIQNQARQALYEANADVFNEEYFVATLDVRTTYECAGHDGERYKTGQGPMPPLHFRCRSLRVPFIHEDILRNRGYKSSFEKQLVQEFAQKNGLPNSYTKREQLPKGFKTKFDQFAQKRNREMVGQVPAKTTFSKWFKEQSPSFQDEYLGKARAEKYRKGLVDIKDFSSASGRTYTLEELFPTG